MAQSPYSAEHHLRVGAKPSQSHYNGCAGGKQTRDMAESPSSGEHHLRVGAKPSQSHSNGFAGGKPTRQG
jgi:hypothetical protein